MKLKYIFLFSAALLMGTSCADFLDKTPISDNVDGNFFTAENMVREQVLSDILRQTIIVTI